MDRNNAKTYLDVITAFANGKTIEHKSIGAGCWDIDENPSFAFPHQYRIKPEPKLVSFTFEDNLLFRDKWIRQKDLKALSRLSWFGPISISLGDNNKMTYIQLLDNFEFEDGSPCGKYVEE